MASGKNFEKEKEDFRAMCLEVMPLAEKFGEIARKYGIEKSAHISVSKEGYLCFENYDNEWEMIRTAFGDPVRIRYSYSEEISIERGGGND